MGILDNINWDETMATGLDDRNNGNVWKIKFIFNENCRPKILKIKNMEGIRYSQGVPFTSAFKCITLPPRKAPFCTYHNDHGHTTAQCHYTPVTSYQPHPQRGRGGFSRGRGGKSGFNNSSFSAYAGYKYNKARPPKKATAMLTTKTSKEDLPLAITSPK